MTEPPEPSPGGVPSREAVRRYLRDAPGRTGKRDIVRAFDVPPEQRPALRSLLRDMMQDGEIAPAGSRRFALPARLPDATVVEVTGTDPDGDPVARPVDWTGDGPVPVVFMAPESRGQPALAPGQRVLARLRRIGGNKYEGRTIKRLSAEPGRVLGVFERHAQGGGRLRPTDRRQKAEWLVPPGEEDGAETGEIVLATPLPRKAHGLGSVRIVERLGRLGEARSVSLICLHAHGIPTEFPSAALAEAEAAGPSSITDEPGQRTDLRDLPLVTIDGEDARDFDDAVFAEADGTGWRLLVAIADVAHYVRPGSALDRAARERGNSVYFPDRVVPMLPEALSNGWCSLKPEVDRCCLFAEIRIDGDGRRTGHRFGRGIMRSTARWTYAGAQAAHEAGEAAAPIPALYCAYAALLAAREARGTLDLDLPEREVRLDEAGQVREVVPRLRLDSHRLIEEFMVLANVCAAEELECLRQPPVYRVHAPPSDEKLDGLRRFLQTFDIDLPAADRLHPRDLDRVLRGVAGREEAPLVNEVVLRSQSQAAYAVENIGHFGLALARYAHFTSPIRRYADLLVHRALVRGLGLGPDGLRDDEAGRLADTADHVTAAERRAAAAERDATERYLAAHLSRRVGDVFEARISGVTRSGLFVTLTRDGASGFVPVSFLPDDQWMHDEAARNLTGRRTRSSYRLAQTLAVRLREADPVTGSLVFEPAEAGTGAPAGDRPGRR